MDPKPKLNPRRENLVGKHDAISVSLKFGNLPPVVISDLDIALNAVSLDTTQCFSANYLEALTEEQRKKLSSLIGDLSLNTGDKTTQKETIKSIVGILNS